MMLLTKWMSMFGASLAVAVVACSAETASSNSDAAAEASGGGSSGGNGSSGSAGSSGGSGSSGSGGSSTGGGGGSDASSSSPDARSGGSDATLEGGTCAVQENDAGTCSDLQALGSLVGLVCMPGEPPQPQGGSIEDGTYVIDTYSAYGGCPQQVVASTTWAVCGDRWDVVAVSAAALDAAIGTPTRINLVAQAQGTTITFTQTCPAASAGLMPRGYTAAPGKLTFIYPDSAQPSTVYVSTYLRR